MAPNYSLTLNLASKRVVVIGAGPVATRRLSDLISSGADLTVIAPIATEEIQSWASKGTIKWLGRPYLVADLNDAWLIVAATGSDFINQEIATWAESHQIWTMIMGDSELSTAWRPAVANGPDGIIVAVTGGRDPKRAMAIRDAISLQIDLGTLPIRAIRKREGFGRVSLVGGGPGDKSLLTLRGRQLLAAADVVVVDRLAPQQILEELSSDIEIIDCGKSPGNHKLTQDQINEIIVDRAKAGLDVVRLKGGDPFVFGRGSEELQACIAAGIECKVVPGVSSAIAVPAAAGIPVTHRGVAQAFTVVNGHGDLPISLAVSQQTFVILMGVDELEKIVDRFLRSGWNQETPISVIENGWSLEQRSTTSTLSKIGELKSTVGFRSPAVIVIGEVVKFREQFGDLHGL